MRRSCRPNVPFAELVKLSRTSIADEMREGHRKRVQGVAHRLNGVNQALIQLKSQLKTGEPHNVVAKTVSKMEGLLAVSGASLVYAGYPFDPSA
jgi:hypothetical protein